MTLLGKPVYGFNKPGSSKTRGAGMNHGVQKHSPNIIQKNNYNVHNNTGQGLNNRTASLNLTKPLSSRNVNNFGIYKSNNGGRFYKDDAYSSQDVRGMLNSVVPKNYKSIIDKYFVTPTQGYVVSYKGVGCSPDISLDNNLFREWDRGAGPTNRVFMPYHNMTIDIRNSIGFFRARQYLLNKKQYVWSIDFLG